MREYLERDGAFLRVFEAGWDNCADTSFSKRIGGRWNPPGEFGALYLNATAAVAAANARALYAGSFYRPEDLQGEAELCLQEFVIPTTTLLDCFTEKGVAACGFAKTFPFKSAYPPCQAIAREELEAGHAGVSTRCASESTSTSFVGEELALFDTITETVAKGRLVRFDAWYPGTR